MQQLIDSIRHDAITQNDGRGKSGSCRVSTGNLCELLSRVSWHDMDCAPKDGTHITVISAHNKLPATTVHWFDGGWHLSVNQMGKYSDYVWGFPTHWMLLPERPEGT